MPNELSEKIYPDGTVVKLRDDTAREQIADKIKSTAPSNVQQYQFTNGVAIIPLFDIDSNAKEILAVYLWGTDVALSFSLSNWSRREFKVYNLTNPSFTGLLYVAVVYY